MSKTPLKRYLEERGKSAESFAAENGFSPWTIRHYARGDKTPSFAKQVDLSTATEGKVTPNDWLAWAQERAA